MLTCKACLRRCISTVCADAANIYLPTRPPPSSRTATQTVARRRRGYATEATHFETPQTSNAVLDVGIRQQYLPESRPRRKRNDIFSEGNLRREVQWLKDPLKLGDHIVQLLRQDGLEKALALVSLASKDIQCTVSWNYLIDFYMSKGKPSDAIKLYNEMKKRAQLPDAHTFTTIFRGLSWHPKHALSVTRALSIYHSMYAVNSPVRPSIIHTNAVLKVCGLAGDMDALLSVAARLPIRGNAAPNNLTFTTILNAIRYHAVEPEKGEQGTSIQAEKQKRAVAQGRRLWEEIRARWEKGDIFIDEELVCAMGRLLLIGSDEKDCDDILSLLEQTMGLPRQVPRIGEPGRRAAQIPEDDPPPSNEIIPVPHDDMTGPELSEIERDPLAPSSRSPPRGQSFVRPGPNTLSLALKASNKARTARAAQKYWGLLTDPSGSYNISPDSENYLEYLRHLRVQRASNLAVELVDEMRLGKLGPGIKVERKTFLVALSCCVRDKKNKHSITHAARLVRLMTDTLPYPDARVLGYYLKLAVSQRPLEWRTLMGVVKGVQEGIRNLRSLLAYEPEKGKQHEADVRELVKEAIRAMDIGLDLGNEEMPEEEKRKFRESRNALQAWVTRMTNQHKMVKEEGDGGWRVWMRKEIRGRSDGDWVEDVEGAQEAADEVERGVRPLVRRTDPAKRKKSVYKKKWMKTKDKQVALAWERLADE